MNLLRSFCTLLLGFYLPLVASAQQPTVKIGVIGPLSGGVAAWGNDVQKSLLFSSKKIGFSNVEFFFEDDRCLGKEAVTAAQKLINVDRIDFGMVVCTESMLTTAPIFEKNKVLVISPITSGAAISEAGDYIFRTWPSDAQAGELLFRHIKSKHKRFGVLTESRGFPEELSKAFLAAAKNSSVDITELIFPSEEVDFLPLLLKLRSKKIEGLLLNINSERLLLNLVKQLRSIDWKVQIYGVYLPGNKSFLKIAGDLANGIVYVDAPSADSTLTSKGKKLFAEYVRLNGELESASFVFPATYEALRLLSLANVTDDKFRQTLYSERFDGIFGSYHFDSNGDIQGVFHELKVIDKGTPRLYSEAG